MIGERGLTYKQYQQMYLTLGVGRKVQLPGYIEENVSKKRGMTNGCPGLNFPSNPVRKERGGWSEKWGGPSYWLVVKDGINPW